MATPKKFNENMSRRADKIARNALRLKRTVAGVALQAVVMGTPVGNPSLWLSHPPAGYVGGRARANWLVGIGAAIEAATQATDPSGGATLATGNARINTSGAGQAIHLTNNVEYIIPLNDGHSKQAPVGFVEQAVQASFAHVRSQRIVD